MKGYRTFKGVSRSTCAKHAKLNRRLSTRLRVEWRGHEEAKVRLWEETTAGIWAGKGGEA